MSVLPSRAACERGIYYMLIINTEHVDPTILIRDNSIQMSGNAKVWKNKINHVNSIIVLNFTNLLFIDFFPSICHLVTNDGTNVLDDHSVFFQVFSCIQAQSLDTGASQVHIVFPFRLQPPILRRLGVNKLLAVGRVDFSCKRALVGFGHACAIQCMGPTERKKKKTASDHKYMTVEILSLK